MAALPIALRQGIRDHVESPSSELAVQFKSLEESVGYPVVFDPDWSMIWEILKPNYPDQATFIPSIAGIVCGWCKAIADWIEDSEVLDDFGGFLALLNERLKLLLETSPKSARPATIYDTEREAFVIYLPHAGPVSSTSAQRGFSSDLRMMLTSGTKDDQSFEATTSGETASGDPDPWAFLGSTEVDARNTTRLVSIQAPTALPDISAIEGPEDLTRRPPYWLFIRQGSNSSVEIKGSHSLTLGLIEKYMKKWCRGNPQVVDRPPLLRINLQESMFGVGLLHDSLTMEPARTFDSINITLLLVLVESALGYTPILDRSNSKEWQFRRTAAFK